MNDCFAFGNQQLQKNPQNSVYIWHSRCSSFLSQFKGMHVDLIGDF